MSAKTIAILSYFSIPGWIFAMHFNTNRRTLLGSFHVRQSLGIMSMGTLIIIIAAFIPSVPIVLSTLLFVFVFWLMGLITAIQGRMKMVPFLGYYFQKWFVAV